MTEPKAILCVEDDADSRVLLQTLLEMEGFKVKVCETSEEAVKLARQDGFSAIVLDNRLPVMSGIEVCRNIRTFDQETPIIFYSALSSPQDRKDAMAAGAQAYLMKPEGFDKIIGTVNSLINKSSFAKS